MLSVTELEALAADLESDRVERKERLTDSDRVMEAICAFANDLPNYGQPGVVFIGLRDDGSCGNFAIEDKLLQQLAAMRSDGRIQPFPIMTVRKLAVRSCDVAVVEVQPAYNPPVRLNGRVWMRVGPTRALASAEDERRLAEKRRAANVPFDQQPVPGSSLADLDLDLFRQEYLPVAVAPEVLLANERSDEHQYPDYIGPCYRQEARMKTIACFNNKGGVGTTSLVYHLAWMYRDLGLRVLAADLDPQATLSARFLDEDRLEEIWVQSKPPLSLLGAIQPLVKGTGDIQPPHVEDADGGIGLLVGDLGLSSVAWVPAPVGIHGNRHSQSCSPAPAPLHSPLHGGVRMAIQLAMPRRVWETQRASEHGAIQGRADRHDGSGL